MTVSIPLYACQAPKELRLTKQEAKQIGIDIQASGYITPPRSINRITARFQRVNSPPCYAVTPSEHYLQARQLFDSARPMNSWGQGNKFWLAEKLAVTAFLSGDISNAIEFSNWATEAYWSSNISDAVNGWTGHVSVLAYKQAVYHALAKQIESAEKFYSRGIRQREANWRPRVLALYNKMSGYWAAGTISKVRGDLEDAKTNFKEAIELGNRAEQKIGSDWFNGTRILMMLVISTGDLAETLAMQGYLAEAEGLIYGALFKFDFFRTPDLAKVYVLNQLSNIYYHQQRYSDAKVVAEIVIKQYLSRCRDWGLGTALARSLKARALLAEGNIDKASETYQELEKALKDNGNLLKTRFGSDLHWIATDILSGRTDQAQFRITTARNWLDEYAGLNTPQIALVEGLQGMAYYYQANLPQAIVLLERSTNILLNTRTTDGVDPVLKRVIFETYLSLLAEQPTEANIIRSFGLVQGIGNDRVLRAERQRTARAAARTPVLAGLVRQEQDLAHQITALKASLVSRASGENKDSGLSIEQSRQTLLVLSESLEALQDKLSDEFPDYDQLINPRPLTAPNVQELLFEDQALLVVHPQREHTLVWAIPASGAISFHTADVGGEKLNRIVDQLRRAVDPETSIRSLADVPAYDLLAAHSLYQKLLEPLEQGWKGAKRVYVVAHGALSRLPFSMLVTKPSNTKVDGLLFTEYREVNWLARSHAVSILPSVSSLNLFTVAQNESVRRPFVGFGDPYFSAVQADKASIEMAAMSAQVRIRSMPQTRSLDSAALAQLPRLPETATELISIANAMGSDPSKSVYLGLDANEATVKSMQLDDVNILAFATHGLIPGDLNGLDQPALALTAPEVANVNGDGLLTMGEILSLDLDADWVVLSACNTAAADGKGAEAVSGLGRAFFYAGARSLLVSNWPVHSNSTAELTKTLFRIQAQDDAPDRSRALQQAKLHLINEAVEFGSDGNPIFSYAHPIFWAPFTIVGDPG